MKRPSDVTVTDTALYFIPVRCERPLAFGRATVEAVVCARASVTVVSGTGRYATGWGEAPLNVQWAWPDGDVGSHSRDMWLQLERPLSVNDREERMKEFCKDLARQLRVFPESGHPVEISTRFMAGNYHDSATLPPLAAQLCFAPFDLALHDAFGRLHGTGVFETLTEEWMNGDLEYYFGEDAAFSNIQQLFRRRYPGSYLVGKPQTRLRAWHLVGYLDALETAAGPSSLQEWIAGDGLDLLKIKLRGYDLDADLARMEAVMVAAGVGESGGGRNGGRTPLRMPPIRGLSLDLNGTPEDAGYLHTILDAMERNMPQAFRLLMYVEEPLAPTLVRDSRAVTSLARRKPLFMDESAVRWHDLVWGREAGWTGVALKTAKTLTGSLMSNCWAGEFGMPVMVQDLTNPMLAQLSHLCLASRVQTICGVESNSMQFYPAASGPEEAIHPGAYRRNEGTLDISTLRGPGFGYRLEEMKRELPERAA